MASALAAAMVMAAAARAAIAPIAAVHNRRPAAATRMQRTRMTPHILSAR